MALRHPTCVPCVLALSLFVGAPSALAQTPERPRFWNRLSFDMDYGLFFFRENLYLELKWYDSSSGKRGEGMLFIEHDAFAHEIVFNPALSLTPWVGVGLEGLLQQDFEAPHHPWLDSFGLGYNRRRMLGLGPFAEFRPWQRSYATREGWFFRLGARIVWMDRQRTHASAIAYSDGLVDTTTFAWTNIGYRVDLGSGLSAHVLVDAGTALWAMNYAGIRIGGGFH